MDERTLRVLEYNKIIDRMAGFASRIPPGTGPAAQTCIGQDQIIRLQGNL